MNPNDFKRIGDLRRSRRLLRNVRQFKQFVCDIYDQVDDIVVRKDTADWPEIREQLEMVGQLLPALLDLVRDNERAKELPL